MNHPHDDPTEAPSDDATTDPADLGFRWRRQKNGEVCIQHRGRLASTLRGHDAQDFLAEVDGASLHDQQQLMARVTGQYKHGNERTASEHPRNRRRGTDNR